MKNYKKRFQRWWMDTDHKPNKKVRRLLEKQNRMEEREMTRREADDALLEDRQEEDEQIHDKVD